MILQGCIYHHPAVLPLYKFKNQQQFHPGMVRSQARMHQCCPEETSEPSGARGFLPLCDSPARAGAGPDSTECNGREKDPHWQLLSQSLQVLTTPGELQISRFKLEASER